MKNEIFELLMKKNKISKAIFIFLIIIRGLHVIIYWIYWRRGDCFILTINGNLRIKRVKLFDGILYSFEN